MASITKIFSQRSQSIFRDRNFWVVIFLVAVIAVIYYAIRFFRILLYDKVPITEPLEFWEYLHNLVGSLFFIPILYSVFRFWWRGAILVWLLSIALILPRLLYLYADNLTRISLNLVFLSIPILILAYIHLELRWRESERKALLEREKEREVYLAQVFKAQEDERKRVAQEIHDDSIQRLAVIASDVQLLAQDKKLDDLPGVKNKAESIKDMIISVSQDLRRITLDLRPTVLDDLGLAPALRWLAEGFQKDSGINVHIEVSGESPLLSKKISVNIFRIVQEALNNIRKHSGATSATINLLFTSDSLMVKVRDNGKGFSFPMTSELTARGKLGLIGMQQRAQIINGNINFQSDPGKGTIITLQCDLQ